MANPNPLHQPPERGSSQAAPPDPKPENGPLPVRALDPAGTGRGSSGAQPLFEVPRLEKTRRR
jgi:hypothetical protein